MVSKYRYTDKEKDILFVLCVSFFLTYLFFLVNNICIAFNLIHNVEMFRESFFFQFFNVVRWIELLGMLIIGIKGAYVSYSRNLHRKTPLYVIPTALLFIVIYNPFYIFMFNLTAWMIINFLVVLVVLSGLISAMIKH
ncbi:MAG TPA: hypothetical protein QF753_07520 [Victivallales bacterium]|nr:hypothetical protein [Victivallales bacterium]